MLYSKNKDTCYTRRWLQYTATVSASLAIFVGGMHLVWASASLPKLYADDSPIPITQDQGSWIASLELLAGIPGAPLGAYFADKFGRKNTLFLTAIPYIISWILIACATDVWPLYIAKILVGLGDGSSFTILPMFIGEIAEDDIRGKLGNCMTVMLDLGSLFLYCIAPWITIRQMSYVGMVFPILLVILLCFIYETPYYLLMKKKSDKARKSLRKYRGTNEIDEEFTEMSNIVEKQMSETSNWLDLYTNKAYFRAFIIMIGLKTMQMMSGIYAMQVFAELIFEAAEEEADNMMLSSSVQAILFGVAQFASGFGAMLIVDKVGRRPLLIISCLGCFCALSMQTTYFYIQYYNLADLGSVQLLPVISLMFYITMYSVGLGAIPLMVPSEMFPTNIKAKAISLTDIYLALLGFLIVNFYQSVAENFGSHIPFGIFALSCLLSIFFVIFVMPETKGKSLEEIQNILKGEIPLKKISAVSNIS
ncbi:facilitated trehalose transporter Tret1-like [Chrysoperla carnea]|uniref:facilitated trehalose transporter Tret1-like n=1 Tax=Chrysoperla carnea TaxID=189513 RepID=UPI001D078F43|nr:facilitated trehalose transporter Tret1-like [Chrysoperla carnea]